jgi:RHS repeat-associated protein
MNNTRSNFFLTSPAGRILVYVGSIAMAGLVLLAGAATHGTSTLFQPVSDSDDTANSTDEGLLNLLFINGFETNQAPKIISLARRYASPLHSYDYPVEVFDAEDDPVLFALDAGPAGMEIDLLTGELIWPSPALGAHPVEIIAQDIFGGFDTQIWTLTVANNSPPQILSAPLVEAQAGQPWSYTPAVVDPDLEVLGYSLRTAPAGMSIGPDTGRMDWLPDTAGDFQVEWQVADPSNALDSQSFTINVALPDDAPPTITSTPPVEATIDHPWFYTVQAEDPNDNIDAFRLVQAPVGMRIDPETGRVEWMPAQFEPADVTIEVLDTTGFSDRQNFTVSVSATPGTTPPEWQGTAALVALLGRTSTFQLSAFDADGDDLRYFVEPLPLPTGMRMSSLTGELEFTPSLDQVGELELKFAVSDGRFRGYRDFTITVPPADGSTRFRGRVMHGLTEPLPGVRLVIGEAEAFAGPDGYFEFEDLAASGPVGMLVDGSTAQIPGTFATVPKAVELIPGAENLLQDPIILLPLDTASADPVDPAQTSQITSAPVTKGGEAFAPVTLTIPPNTARWEATGELYDGDIHITNIPDNALSPQPLPDELGFSVYVAMQPFGVVYDEPVPISFPNVDDLLPGSSMAIFGLDHNTGEFVQFGEAEVSADGETVDSIGGVVVANSWHGIVLPALIGVPNTPDDPDQCGAACGSLVGLTEGNLNITHSLPAWQSQGQSRSVTLEYNSTSADARPIVRFDQRNNSPSLRRPAISGASLNVGGVTFTEERFWQGDRFFGMRGALQFDATGCPTEVYDYLIDFSSTIPDGFGTRRIQVAGKLALINLRDSAFGTGWHVQGLEQIFFGAAGDAMIMDGSAEATIFRTGPGGFETPDGEFSTLEATADGYRRVFSDGRVRVYRVDGRLVEQSDRNGNITAYSYNANGLIETVTDPVGLETRFDYFAGKLASITDPAGRITRFEHNAFGHLVRIIEPDGAARTLEYDGPSGRLIRRTNQRDFATSYDYNAFGRLESAERADGSIAAARAIAITGLIDPESDNGTPDNPAPAVLTRDVEALLFDGNGNLTRFKTDQRGRTTERIDAIGQVTRIGRDEDSNPMLTIRPDGSTVIRTFDSRGNVLTETEQANGATTTWTYDPFDQITSTTDPLGRTTTFERDARGNLTRIVNPLGHETLMEYNAQGLMTRRVDPNGLETRLEYNARGLVTTRTETPSDAPQSARTTTFEYTAAGDPVRIVTPTGTIQEFSYDAKGRPTEITDNLGQRVVMEYDPAGNLIRTETRAADGSVVTVQEQNFDELDRLLESRSPHSDTEDSVTQFAYDGEGNQTGVIDPNGRVTVREYDDIDRLVRETDPAGGLTEFGYDERNQLNRVVAPNNATTTFDFDRLARQTAEHSPDRGTITQEYDLANKVTASTDARGIRREMTYDALNRLKTVTFPQPGEDITFTYDTCPNGIGRICRIDDESGTTEYEYDGFGNITRTRKTELGIEYTTDYEYDLEDRVTAIFYPAGRRVEYGRDILGRVTEVRAEVAGQMQPILSNIQYRADGQITAAMFGNGLRETRTYDLQGRLVHQDLKDETDLIVDERTYDYDPAGNITARTGTPGDQHYAYDALDRLTGQEITTESKTWQYAYGPNHNRQTRTDGDGLNEIYSYQPDTNRLTEIDKFLGQQSQTVPPTRQFIYNQTNRFAEYIEDGQTVARYTYNALGQRTRKGLDPETTLFHYDVGISLLGESDDAGNPTREYLWLNNRPVAQIESTGLVTYLHADHLLTPRVGTSDGQSIVWRWEGEAFGDIDATGLIEINLRFPGQYFDRETGQHYNNFRDYASKIGRYVQSDPFGLQGGLNLFMYANQNPIRFSDMSGLFPDGNNPFDGLPRSPFPDVDFICRVTGFLCPGVPVPAPAFIVRIQEQIDCYSCEAECVIENMVGVSSAALQAADTALKREARRTARTAAQVASHVVSRANIAISVFQLGLTANCWAQCK